MLSAIQRTYSRPSACGHSAASTLDPYTSPNPVGWEKVSSPRPIELVNTSTLVPATSSMSRQACSGVIGGSKAMKVVESPSELKISRGQFGGPSGSGVSLNSMLLSGQLRQTACRPRSRATEPRRLKAGHPGPGYEGFSAVLNEYARGVVEAAKGEATGHRGIPRVGWEMDGEC